MSDALQGAGAPAAAGQNPNPGGTGQPPAGGAEAGSGDAPVNGGAPAEDTSVQNTEPPKDADNNPDGKGELETLRADNARLTQELGGAKQELDALRKSKKGLEEDLHKKKSELEEARKQDVDQLLNEKRTLEKVSDEGRERIQVLEAALRKSETTLLEKENDYKELTTKHEKQAVDHAYNTAIGDSMNKWNVSTDSQDMVSNNFKGKVSHYTAEDGQIHFRSDDGQSTPLDDMMKEWVQTPQGQRNTDAPLFNGGGAGGSDGQGVTVGLAHDVKLYDGEIGTRGEQIAMVNNVDRMTALMSHFGKTDVDDFIRNIKRPKNSMAAGIGTGISVLNRR